jgi:hypothetical protein
MMFIIYVGLYLCWQSIVMQRLVSDTAVHKEQKRKKQFKNTKRNKHIGRTNTIENRNHEVTRVKKQTFYVQVYYMYMYMYMFRT